MNGSEGLQNLQYFNYSQFKKIVFGYNLDDSYFSFLINHRLYNNQSTVEQDSHNNDKLKT